MYDIPRGIKRGSPSNDMILNINGGEDSVNPSLEGSSDKELNSSLANE